MMNTVQAHARLCARPIVTRQDAVVAVLVADTSQGVLAVASADAALTSDFVADPDADYALQEHRMLRELGLGNNRLLVTNGVGGGGGGHPLLLLPAPGNARAGAGGGGGWQNGGGGGGGGGHRHAGNG